MKLIRCENCEDVVRLIHTKWRKCECGESGGQYNDDLVTATVGGDCEVIGIRNDFFEAKGKDRKDLNSIIEGEYEGDVQIHRIESPEGPKLKMEVEEIDKDTNKLTFKDDRKYTINTDDKSPESVEVPSNPKGPSFKDKAIKKEDIQRLKGLVFENLK